MMHLQKLPNNTFAHGFSAYKLFWVFLSGSLFGFIHENTWAIIKLGEPHLRKGLIYGPLIPIYGFGALLFVLFLHRVKKTAHIFLLGSLLGAAFEFMTSYIQQHVFGSVSWDYSTYPLNIGGRTNLAYAAFWGLLCILLLKYLYPKISMAVDKLPERSGKVITVILAFFIMADCGISALAVFRMGQRNENIKASNRIEKLLDKYYPDNVLQPIFNNLEFAERNAGFGINKEGG